jgi:tryptophanyl-tRNA synthetase
MRVLTGIRPTGKIHLGNYFGAIKPLLRFADYADVFLFIADLHALTDFNSLEEINKATLELAATIFALVGNKKNVLIWQQSQVPQVAEVSYYLSSLVGHTYLQKSHAFKAATADGKTISGALFFYPVLMAADILLFNADIVPIGEDQLQHLEICRDIAERANNRFGLKLKLPEPHIVNFGKVVTGTDGRKMSKSYGNTVPIFCSPEEFRQIVFRIATDSSPLGSSLHLEKSVLYEYLLLVLPEQELESVRKDCLEGKMGWGHVKQVLVEALVNYFGAYRKVYLELISDISLLRTLLREGSEKAKEEAENVACQFRSLLRV